MTHKCPADGCTEQLPQSTLACKPHWFKVSNKTRRAVNASWKAFRAGRASFDAYLAMRDDAIDEMNAP